MREQLMHAGEALWLLVPLLLCDFICCIRLGLQPFDRVPMPKEKAVVSCLTIALCSHRFRAWHKVEVRAAWCTCWAIVFCIAIFRLLVGWFCMTCCV